LNSENYYNCFLKPEDNPSYYFTPDPTAHTRFGVIFNQWNSSNERNFLVGLKSSLNASILPQINWENTKYEILTSDSAVYIGEYNISINFPNKNENYSGISKFTFIHTNSGLWFIKSWQDFQKQSDDTVKTWSILKAQIST
jgi:hypothetical protein